MLVGRMIGMVCILAGCAGVLMNWYERKRQQQAFMGECIRLFSRWRYAVLKEHLRLYDFIESYDGRIKEMDDLLQELWHKLERNSYPSGTVAWQELLQEKRQILPLGEEAFHILSDSGDAFFGNSREEVLRCTEACRDRMEEALAEEKRETARKWRVYMPVGMLGGVMLIILLV